MANTTFNGPVRSENGFQTVSINPATGTITVTATFGATTAVTTLTATSIAGALTSTTTTSAALLAIGNAVNTSGKALGTTLYNTTTNTFYVAQGATAGSTWIDSSDGTTVITPV